MRPTMGAGAIRGGAKMARAKVCGSGGGRSRVSKLACGRLDVFWRYARIAVRLWIRE